jgi:molecular chaperone GrpE
MSNEPDPTPVTEPEAPAKGNSNGQPGSEVETLRARAEAAERDRDQYLVLLKSKTAEFENYQKRQRRIQEEESKYSHGGFALELLPVLDNLERATEAAKKVGETGPLVQGVAMVHSQFLELLRRHGVTRMEDLGKPFDPNRHQAVLQQPSAEHPPQTVVGILAPGYLLHDRVLRPAQVIVSTGANNP